MDYLNVARCVAILHRRSQNFLVEACQKLGLTYSEYVLFMRVFENEGTSQEDLAALLFVDKAVVTRTMKLLEEKNLIYREKDAVDRRMKRIYLTEFGRSQQEFLVKVLNSWADYLVAGMERSEITQLMQGFHKLAERSCQADFRKISDGLGKE